MLRFVVLLSLIIINGPVIAQPSEVIAGSFLGYNGELQISVMGLPTFDQFPVFSSVSNNQRALNVGTNADNGFAELVQGKPTFAGNYIISSKSCGSNCVQHWIVDVRTREIVTTLISQGGLSYKRDSRLLVKNHQLQDAPHLIAGAVSEYPISFYEFFDGNLKHLVTVNPHSVLEYSDKK